jgi:N-acetylmuramoyl-L-alanine amidase
MNRILIVVVMCVMCLPAISFANGRCIPGRFSIAIDVGHSIKNSGAISARGIREYRFNRRIANLLWRELVKRGFSKAFLVKGKGGEEITLKERAEIANRTGAGLMISVHHDSVQPRYMSPWVYKKKELLYSDIFHGFSIFYSGKNPKSRDSLSFAELLGGEMVKDGFTATLCHAEKIEGEGRELVDREKGVYKFDDLVVLKEAEMPAILLECGIIVNRAEEHDLSRLSYQRKMVSSVVHAVKKYCGSR